MKSHFKFDVFISHSVIDSSAAWELGQRLEKDGLRVWINEQQLKVGEANIQKLQKGLESSKTLILLLSKNTFSSEWHFLERQTLLFRDSGNSQRKFIPLRIDNSEIKDSIKKYSFLDWSIKSEEVYSKVLALCQNQLPKSQINTREEIQIISSTKTLKGHSGLVKRIAMTPNGDIAISASNDKTLRVWDLEKGICAFELSEHKDAIWATAISADGKIFISGSYDGIIRVWDLSRGNSFQKLEGHLTAIRDVSITPNGKLAVSVCQRGDIFIWDLIKGKRISVISTKSSLWSVAVTSDGKKIVTGDDENNICIWESKSGNKIAELNGHNGTIEGLAIAKNGKLIVSGSSDNTVRLWDIESGRCFATLEGHTDVVWSVAITENEKRIVSGSGDATVRVWDVESGDCLAILEGHTSQIYGLALSASGDRVIASSRDSTIRLWDLPIINPKAFKGATRYTNAKVLLVGDSGVGKSGLHIRLTQNRFEITASTDAAWATQLPLSDTNNNKNIEREIWLWDFAGQSDYRLIHQLFMDETSLAILVFNPQSENPFEGLAQWTYDLERAARRTFKKILVAGRCDRGGMMVSKKAIELFRTQHNFDVFLETSANTGVGCSELHNAIIQTIPWDDIPWTSSPRIFLILKKEIVELKEQGKVLLRISELKQQLEIKLPNEPFSLDELRAVIGLLAGPGVVWKLEFGDFILLQPERINAYAAAVIRKVRTHTEEIGIILEDDVLSGILDYQDMKRLPNEEEQIVLRAMHQTFINHELCLREQTEQGTLLIFPSYFKRERPELARHPAIFVTYQFNGQLDEIYSTLVVRLHHTPTFNKDQLWKFAADFKTQEGRIIGIKMTKLNEGKAEIAVYFEPKISDDIKVTFIRYVHEHLRLKGSDIVRLRHYVCGNCGTPVENRKTAFERLAKGKKDIICVNCEKRILLWDLIERKFASEELQQEVYKLEEKVRQSIDNESKELILVGHTFSIAGEAGQIFRPTSNSDWGIDGEIEFKTDKGDASGKRVYLQLKSGDSYLRRRKSDGKEIFSVKNTRHLEYWVSQNYPVMLVVRTSDNKTRWMNVTNYIKFMGVISKQIVFEGEPFTVLNILKLRDKVLNE